ncbi:N-acetyltransferase 8 [Phytophthora nicotianae]|uniref:N-acetyltransferase 8 n=1 Tax=Phytophthora nicotianae TaxID=4792 RepID=A0A0W8DAU0_PHYNI|nr:N-acetyltransferase 8 [Phytophthora nicotianae]
MVELYTQSVPDTSGGAKVNWADILIIVAVLFFTMVVAVIASIQAGESHLANYFPCIKQAKRNNAQALESPGDAYLAPEATPGKKLPVGDERGSTISQNRPSASLIARDGPEHQVNEVSNFFLADRGMQWYFVGGALFASNIGAEHFIGMAGDGARRGIAVAMYEWYAAILILCLGWIFSPIYRRCGVYTTPEFLEYRFGAPCRHYLSLITVIMYVLTKMSASIYGGAIVFQATLGWNLYLGAGVCIALSAMYSIAGGLRAVMYTDLFQMCVFTLGGLVVFVYSTNQIGGFEGIKENLANQDRSGWFHLWKPTDDPDYPWTGMIFGQPLGSIWYWCMDQDLVQRVLSAKDTANAKAGCSFASMLKYHYRYDVESRVRVCAGSSVVTNDIYLKFRPDASHKQLVWVGRMSILVFAVLSFCWIPIMRNGTGLYEQIVEIQSYLTPPIGIVLVLGVAWKPANVYGAFSAMIVGGLLGFSRLIFVTIKDDSMDGDLPGVINTFFYMNFQHFALLLWLTAMVVCVVVSLLTQHKSRPSEDVRKYMIHWDKVLKLDATELVKPMWVNVLVAGSGIAALAVTFSMWIYFA